MFSMKHKFAFVKIFVVLNTFTNYYYFHIIGDDYKA